jgi:superfamily II DNA/RNA helicase
MRNSQENQGVDQKDIRLVIQWKATCDMCTLWQRFGRAGRSLLLDAIAILFVEPSHTDAKRNEKEARREKQAAGKGKRSASESWTQGRVNKRVAVEREAAEGSKQRRPDNPTGGTEDLNDYEAKRREEYGRSVAEPSRKNASVKLEPAMDDFINAATRGGVGCYRVPAKWLLGWDKASEL